MAQAKKYLVLGLGVSGQSAAKFLRRRGHDVVGVDRRVAQSPELFAPLAQVDVLLMSEESAPDVAGFDGLIVSPGVSPKHPWVLAAQQAGVEVFGEAELASRNLTQPCIGVTGTNGKTTVTSMIAHAMTCSGIPARAVGNIGVPLTQAIDEEAPDTVLVVELSSWQLETMDTPIFDAGVILNITPDHLDRHGTMEAYAEAKLRLYQCLKPSGRLYLHPDMSQAFSEQVKGIHYQTFTTYPTDYHAENAEAAYCLCKPWGITRQQFDEALKTFAKPPHRNEYIRTLGGVDYYNDSKGTNLDAVIKAVQCLPKGCILIAGGSDKGSDFSPWIQAFSGKVRSICAIGETANKLVEQLGSSISVDVCATLDNALVRAREIARPGETVLLSPGCSSFDMFDNYAHRGDVFKDLVQNLSE